MDAMKTGDRIFGMSTPGEIVDMAGEGQIKIDSVLLLTETGF